MQSCKEKEGLLFFTACLLTNRPVLEFPSDTLDLRCQQSVDQLAHSVQVHQMNNLSSQEPDHCHLYLEYVQLLVH
jgi:hypothetical protein